MRPSGGVQPSKRIIIHPCREIPNCFFFISNCRHSADLKGRIKTFLSCIVVYSKSLKIYSNYKYHTELNGRQKFWILEHIPQYSSVNQLLQLDKNNFPKELSPHNCVNSGVMRRNPEKGIRRIQNLLSLISLLNKTPNV